MTAMRTQIFICLSFFHNASSRPAWQEILRPAHGRPEVTLRRIPRGNCRNVRRTRTPGPPSGNSPWKRSSKAAVRPSDPCSPDRGRRTRPYGNTGARRPFHSGGIETRKWASDSLLFNRDVAGRPLPGGPMSSTIIPPPENAIARQGRLGPLPAPPLPFLSF